MNEFVKELSGYIETVPEKIKGISEVELGRRAAGKWSGKEIMGHLCDSAMNNLERFIRIQYEGKPYKIASYDQDNWVMIQNYQQMDTEAIIELWVCLNKQIFRLITDLSEEKLSYPCQVGDQLFNLEWLIKDYLEHLVHHLEQICDL